MKMFRSSSFNSFLHRDNGSREKDAENNPYQNFEDLETQLNLIRKEIADDTFRNHSGHSQHDTMDRSPRQLQTTQMKIDPKQIQEISDRLRYLNLQWKHDIKGNHVKTSWNDTRLQNIKKNSSGLRVRRLTTLSSELRMLSETVLSKDRCDVSISNMSGLTAATVPSCASWDIPNGSSHHVSKPTIDDGESLSSAADSDNVVTKIEESPMSKVSPCDTRLTNTEGESKQSKDEHDELPQEPRMQSGVNAVTMKKSDDGNEKSTSQQRSILDHEKDIDKLWQESLVVQKAVLEVDKRETGIMDNDSNPQQLTPELPKTYEISLDRNGSHSQEHTNSIKKLVSDTKNGFCLAKCQSVSGQAVTVLAMPTILASMVSPATMVQVLQLQFVPIPQETKEEDKLHIICQEDKSLSSLDKCFMRTSNHSINLSKPPLHPQASYTVKSTIGDRKPNTPTRHEITTRSHDDESTSATITQTRHDPEDHQEVRQSHVQSHSNPSLQISSERLEDASHRCQRSYDISIPIVPQVVSAMNDQIETSRQESYPTCQDELKAMSKPIAESRFGHQQKIDPPETEKEEIRQESVTPEPVQISKRSSDHIGAIPVERKVHRNTSKGSKGTRSSERPRVKIDERNKHQVAEKRSKRVRSSEQSCSRSGESSTYPSKYTKSKDTGTHGHSILRSGETFEYFAAEEKRNEKVNESDRKKMDDLKREETYEAVDMVLRDIRKRQIDRMISQRVGARPLGASMAEERALQKIYGKANRRLRDNGIDGKYREVDTLLDPTAYRSRRHGITEVNRLKLKRDTTPTRRMEQKDLDHVERRQFLVDARNEIASMEKRENRMRLLSDSIERKRRESRSEKEEHSYRASSSFLSASFQRSTPN